MQRAAERVGTEGADLAHRETYAVRAVVVLEVTAALEEAVEGVLLVGVWGGGGVVVVGVVHG